MSAYLGSVGAALTTMVANLSSHKRGWDDRWEAFSDWADRGKAMQERLLSLVDEDTYAFNEIMAAFGLPKKSTERERSLTSRRTRGLNSNASNAARLRAAPVSCPAAPSM